MLRCQELKNQIAETEPLSEMRRLLGEYKESGDEGITAEFGQQRDDFEEELNEIRENLQQAIDELISKHPHAEEFANKITVQGGSVISKTGLNFYGVSEVYLPSVVEVVEGKLEFFDLNSAENLEPPQTVEGNLDLRSLTSAEGLSLPEKIGGDLNLSNLTSAEDLEFPEKVGGTLSLHSLTSARGLNLPDKIGGSIRLTSITSAEDLQLPQMVKGALDLRNVTSAEGLKLPEEVGLDIFLVDLISAKHLDLFHVNVGGSIYLDSLSAKERKVLKQEYPRLANKITRF
jgi:hypothetical protein